MLRRALAVAANAARNLVALGVETVRAAAIAIG
jgi:hypothetical protein